MAGLVPAIHVFRAIILLKTWKAGHDECSVCRKHSAQNSSTAPRKITIIFSLVGNGFCRRLPLSFVEHQQTD
jgi:hypothetical protein